jgi:hypothetical protein
MGKKSAHTGESPKDRSINIMDKFITRNQNREKHQPFRSGIRKDPNIPIEHSKQYSFKLDSMWVNFQQKYEFNPLHRHGGLYSFVIWIEVPYFLNFEKDISPGKKSIDNRSGTFEFTYVDVVGQLRGECIPVDKTYEGDIILFPAALHHMVHPFYSSDKYRISVAGNITVVKND